MVAVSIKEECQLHWSGGGDCMDKIQSGITAEKDVHAVFGPAAS